MRELTIAVTVALSLAGTASAQTASAPAQGTAPADLIQLRQQMDVVSRMLSTMEAQRTASAAQKDAVPVADLRSTPKAAPALGEGIVLPAPPAATPAATPAPDPAAAPSDKADATPEPAAAEQVARGFLSFGYSFNANRPGSGANQLRVFDYDDRRLKLDVGELVLQHTPTKPGTFGFRTDLVTGMSVPRISAASGLFRNMDTGVATTNFDVQQAYGSYLAPIGSGLRVDAGKFTTHVGAEVIEGADGYGDTYTRGYLFGYAEPFTHTGVRASYTFHPVAAATVLVVNGWDNARDNNGSKSIGAQVALTPAKTLTVYANYIGGAERADSGDKRHLIDFVAVAKPRDTVTVTASYDYGFERHGAGAEADASWQGVSGIVKVDLSKVYGVAARAEYFTDPTGVRTGTAQRLVGFTLTPSAKVSSHLVVRGDIRFDRSNAGVFEKGADTASHQFTAALNALLVF